MSVLLLLSLLLVLYSAPQDVRTSGLDHLRQSQEWAFYVGRLDGSLRAFLDAPELPMTACTA
eukprot:4626517-Amphidinium_carterae.2